MAVAFTAASCGAAGFPKAQSQGGAPWVRVETAHMSLISHQGEEDARAAAARLELWWGAMSEAMPVAMADLQPVKPTVLAFRNGWEADGASPRIKGAYFAFPP